MSISQKIMVYRWFFAAFLVFSSAQTVLSALRAGHAGLHHAVLGGAEILGAVLLLIQGGRLPGSLILLAVFAFAGYLGWSAGEIPARFIFYAGTTLFLMLDR